MAPVVAVLLLALGGRALDQDGAEEAASLGASSGQVPSPFLVLARPPEPKHIDAEAMMRAELNAMKDAGDFKAGAIMMPKWNPPYPDTRKAPSAEDVSLKVNKIDWDHLAVDGHKNYRAFPQHVFAASKKEELADAADDGELPGLSELEKAAKEEPTPQSLAVKKTEQLMVLAADIQECKSVKALCFKAHEHIYKGRSKDEGAMAEMQEKKCKPLADKCHMKAAIQRMKTCDKMALDVLKAKKPKAAKAYGSGYTSGYTSGKAATPKQQPDQAMPPPPGSSFSSTSSRVTEDSVEMLQETESTYASMPSYASAVPSADQLVKAEKPIEEELIKLEKGDGEFVQKGLHAPAAKLTPKDEIKMYTSAQLDSFEYKLSSDRARVNLPEVEGIFGHTAYAKTVCKGAADECDLGKEDCKQMTKVCEDEIGKVKEVLCGMKRVKIPKQVSMASYASTTKASTQPESEQPKPKEAGSAPTHPTQRW